MIQTIVNLYDVFCQDYDCDEGFFSTNPYDYLKLV